MNSSYCGAGRRRERRARIIAWPSPQSSVQMTGYSPVLVGVITSVVSIPGTASCFWPNSGTQNEWITSRERSVSSTVRSTGRTSCPDVNFVVARVLERPGELLRGDLDPERVRAGVVVLGEHDRADDRDRGDEDRRDRRPDDLEPGVPVDRRAVRVVVGRHAEPEDRVDDHGRDDREDRDADRGREPEGELDPLPLLGGDVGQPRNEDGDQRRDVPRRRRITMRTIEPLRTAASLHEPVTDPRASTVRQMTPISGRHESRASPRTRRTQQWDSESASF